MKKILSLVLVLSLVLGSLGFAFAVPKDVKKTNYEDAVTRLMALEIISGFPDGTFRPNESVTRAQCAKIMIHALGVGSAAEYAVGETKFTDVAANHWAAGYINVASDMKIINGYGDGNFGPEDKVTYAQAVTMIVRALGFEPKAQAIGGYPGGYLAIAAEEEITDDINVVNTLAATRGDVALMVDNALTVPMMYQKTWGQYPEYVNDDEDKTLLKTKLGVDEVSGQVIAVSETDSSLEENEIKITNDDGTDDYDMLVDGVNFASLLGLEVTVWADGDEILDFDIDTDEDDIIFDSVYAADEEEVELFVDDSTYDWAKNAVVYENFEKIDAEDISDDAYGYFVFENDEVSFANVFDFSTNYADLVTEADRDEIDVNGSGDLDIDDYEDGIHAYDKNFNKVDISDADMGSVIYSWEASDELYIVIVNDKVKGELDRVKDTKIYIDGEDYLTGDTTYSTNSDDEINSFNGDADELTDLVGENVEVLLDIHGDVNHIRGDVLATSDLIFGVLLDVDKSYFKYKAKIFIQDDEEEVYEFEKVIDYTGDYGAGSGNIQQHIDKLVAFKLNKDGEIAEQEFYVYDSSDVFVNSDESADLSDDYDVVSKIGEYRFNDNNDTIEDYSGNTINERYYVEEDTVLFNIDSDNDVELVEFEDVEDITSDLTTLFIVKDQKGNDLVAVVFDELEALSTDCEFAVVTENPWLTSDGWKVELDVFEWGVEKFIIEDNSSNIDDKLEEGKVISFKLNGDDEITSVIIKSIVETVDQVDGKYIDIDTGNGTTWLKFDNDAVIYLLDEDRDIDKRLEYDDIDENDKVIYALDDGRIAALTVVTEAFENEDDDTEVVTDGTVTYINDPGNNPSTVAIEVVDADNNFTEYVRADGDMSLSVAKFLCTDDNEDIIDGADVDFEMDSDGNIIAINEISLANDHSSSDFTIIDSSVVDGLIVEGNDYKLDDVTVDADDVTIKDTKITGNLVVNGDYFTSKENIITGTTTVNGKDASFNTIFKGNVIVDADGTIFTNVTAEGNVIVKAGADATFTDTNFSAATNLSVAGDVTISGTTGSLNPANVTTTGNGIVDDSEANDDYKDDIQEAIDVAVNVIKGYASSNNASAMTIAQLEAAGVTGLVSANLDEYKAAVAAANAADVDTTAEIQTIIDTVNEAQESAALIQDAIDAVNDAANQVELLAALKADYFTDVDVNLIVEYETAIGAATTNTIAKIQVEIDDVNAVANAKADLEAATLDAQQVAFDTNKATTVTAVETAVKTYLETLIEDATVAVTWTEAPVNITGAIAAADYNFEVVISGTSKAPDETIIALSINVEITCEDAIAAKTILEAAALDGQIVAFDTDTATTVTAVEAAVKTYLETLITDATVAVTWSNPSGTITGAVAAADYNFAVDITGTDMTTETIATLSINVEITSDANIAKATLEVAILDAQTVAFDTDTATTVSAVKTAVKIYLETLITDATVAVTWTDAPVSITGAVAAADYNFAVDITGADTTIENIAALLINVEIQ